MQIIGTNLCDISEFPSKKGNMYLFQLVMNAFREHKRARRELDTLNINKFPISVCINKCEILIGHRD